MRPQPEVIYERLVAIGRAAEIVDRLKGGWNMRPDDSVYKTCADAAELIDLMQRERATMIGYAQGLESRIDCMDCEIGWWREQIMKLKAYAGKNR